MTSSARSRRARREPLIPALLPGLSPRNVVAHALALIPSDMPLSEWLASVMPEGEWASYSDEDLAACILGHAVRLASDGWETAYAPESRRGRAR